MAIIVHYSKIKHNERSRIKPTTTTLDMELEKEVFLSLLLICYPCGFLM
jgi:hypothetical protein